MYVEDLSFIILITGFCTSLCRLNTLSHRTLGCPKPIETWPVCSPSTTISRWPIKKSPSWSSKKMRRSLLCATRSQTWRRQRQNWRLQWHRHSNNRRTNRKRKVRLSKSSSRGLKRLIGSVKQWQSGLRCLRKDSSWPSSRNQRQRRKVVKSHSSRDSTRLEQMS